jgi:AraC-like DNA-binding protein
MATVFKSHIGVTPMQYRRRYQPTGIAENGE